jgi:selenide, water dikinase
LLDQDNVLLATTDFFMPVVDDPFDFGRIAATNAISDIYAMGGRPILALAILGWPVDKLPAEIANEVIAGARSVAAECNISIAGGHSIDTPEPIFGLAVNGLVPATQLKRNSSAESGDILVLTKPLGIGIHTTALKKGLLRDEHSKLATDMMVLSNKIGRELAGLPAVHAMTDVTGFGLAGHLLEMIGPRKLGANLYFDKLPVLPRLEEYVAAGAVPGGTARNFTSFRSSVSGATEGLRRSIVCDPQTSGGLLIAVAPEALATLKEIAAKFEGYPKPTVIGEIHSSNPGIHII